MSFFKTRRRAALILLACAAGPALAAPPASSPYFTDVQESHVQDATSESIGQVNMIACIMHSMRPDALVNQGPYIALVDKNTCDAEKSGGASSSGADAGASQAPDYMTAVVDSTRASNSDPMLVKAWISFKENDQAVTVFAHISATEAPSSGNPYGVFRLDYCGRPDGVTGGSCMMNGFMEATDGSLSYYEVDGGGGGGQTTALKLASVGTSTGSGNVSMQQSGGGSQSSAFNFAYDSGHFLRGDDQGASECFSRDASDPETGVSVWQYGLYDSTTGERVTRKSGFPIDYTSGGTLYHGYIGYYGLSSQPGAPIPADGSTVQKVDYQNNAATTTTFTVASKAGRLMRYTKQTTTLHAIDQIQLQAFINDATGSGLPHSNSQYMVYWDEATQKFIATSEMQCGQNGCQSTALTPTVSVDPSFWSSMGLQGWSQSLGGGDVFVALNNPGSPLDTTTVIYHSQDLVYPNDPNLPAALYCVSNCPTAASIQAYFTQSQGAPVASPYADGTYNSWQPTTTPESYALAGNVLTSAGTDVTFTDAQAYQQYPQYQNGVMSGRLAANLADAQCGQDINNHDQYCDWKISAADVYYQWQTGPNGWNQFTAIKDANGAFVPFEAPLNVKFTVPANAQGAQLPYGNYAGSTLVLQYGNFGDLWGIPGYCVSPLTNATVNCGTPNSRYVPQFTIPYDPSASPQQGVVTSSENNTTTNYLVKWLEREIRFARKDPSACGTLALPTNVTLPDQTQLKDPSDSGSSVYLGVKPDVSAAPRVIQGDVKF